MEFLKTLDDSGVLDWGIPMLLILGLLATKRTQ